MSLAPRVLERALQKAGYMPEPAPQPGASPEPADLVVDSMADKLLAFINRADAAVIPQLKSVLGSTAGDQLQARNRRVARALGACSCFGEDDACAACGGRGAPGWRLPDRGQFEAIVRPALQKISQSRISHRNGHLQSLQPQEE
jgi:hypothetical protein